MDNYQTTNNNAIAGGFKKENTKYNKVTSNEITIRLNKININDCKKEPEYKGLIIHGLKKINDKIRITPITHILFTMLLEKFNKTKEQIIVLSLKEYMDKRDLKDKKHARQQIKDSLELVKAFIIEYRGRNKSIIGESLISRFEIKRNGIYLITFENTFYEILKSSSFIHLPEKAYKVDHFRNPCAWNLITKIMEHKKMNKKKNNVNCISVRKLVESCPNMKLNTDHIWRDIIEPFERGLNYFEDLFKWNYRKCDRLLSKNEKITNFYEWINLYIEFKWWGISSYRGVYLAA